MMMMTTTKVNIDGLKKSLAVNMGQLLQVSINEAILSLSFTKRLRVCVKAGVDISNVLRDKLFNRLLKL